MRRAFVLGACVVRDFVVSWCNPDCGCYNLSALGSKLDGGSGAPRRAAVRG